jgi:hypothetical protein
VAVVAAEVTVAAGAEAAGGKIRSRIFLASSARKSDSSLLFSLLTSPITHFSRSQQQARTRAGLLLFPHLSREPSATSYIIKHMGIRIAALLGWGVVIYAVMFLLWSIFITYGFANGLLPRVAGTIVLIAIGVIAGRSLRAHSWRDILPYSLAWAVMMGIFDVVMSVPFAGWQVFMDWTVWAGYALVVLSPLFALYPRFERFSMRAPLV